LSGSKNEGFFVDVLYYSKKSKQRKWLGFPKWTFIFVQNRIFPKKILQKKPRFSFLPEHAANADFFIENYHCNLFLVGVRSKLRSNNLGKTSSGQPKNGKNVIRLPQKRENCHPVNLKTGKLSSTSFTTVK
jgi:hypothetical protein